MKASHVAKTFPRYLVQCSGAPSSIVVHTGTQFTSKLFCATRVRLEINNLHIKTFHPQIIFQKESSNRYFSAASDHMSASIRNLVSSILTLLRTPKKLTPRFNWTSIIWSRVLQSTSTYDYGERKGVNRVTIRCVLLRPHFVDRSQSVALSAASHYRYEAQITATAWHRVHQATHTEL